MKKIIILTCIMFLTACAHNMGYRIPDGMDQTTFRQQSVVCGFDKLNNGGLIFGPAIIVLPVIAIAAGIRAHQYKTFQECMEAAGYTCISDCPIDRP